MLQCWMQQRTAECGMKCWCREVLGAEVLDVHAGSILHAWMQCLRGIVNKVISVYQAYLGSSLLSAVKGNMYM